MSKSNTSGWLIFSSFVISFMAYFFDKSLLLFAGVLAWFAALLLFSTLKSKKLLIILFILSILALGLCFYKGYEVDFIKLFTINQYLLSLLIGVGFLRLIATPKEDKTQVHPVGKKAFFKTYLGVHLFGSVINLSSLILVADKMYKKAALTNLQIVTLSRAFASDAYWSPFFVAFAAAITYAPKLDARIILLNGVFLALVTFLITYFELTKSKKYDIKKFEGYPISYETLYIPLLLAILVLGTKSFFDVKVIVLISLFSFVLTLFILPLKTNIKKAFEEINSHINEELPKMKTELSLFLIAGFFGISISFILLGLDIPLPFKEFDYIVASLLLALFIILGFIGIHPIITIAIIGDFLSSVNNTLLAVTFLMAWATTVSTSPFSGLNLTMSARYNINAKEIFSLNIFYTLKMYFVSVLSLYFLDKFVLA